ncbi:hypothetical protein NMG60_11022508 [Bertholletia excelsa]
MDGDAQRVIDLCRQTPEGPFHNLTVHNDAVLHMAIYSKQKQLVLDLLRELPKGHVEKMTITNDSGRTVLHEAAASNRIVPAAVEMLRKAPELLTMKSKAGETAIFLAAWYGKMEMFNFLDGDGKKLFSSEGDTEDEVEIEKKRANYVRDDKTTILHIAILAEHFGKYPLRGENDLCYGLRCKFLAASSCSCCSWLFFNFCSTILHNLCPH